MSVLYTSHSVIMLRSVEQKSKTLGTQKTLFKQALICVVILSGCHGSREQKYILNCLLDCHEVW